eukprot:2578263-Prymnesium_polylepis.1
MHRRRRQRKQSGNQAIKRSSRGCTRRRRRPCASHEQPPVSFGQSANQTIKPSSHQPISQSANHLAPLDEQRGQQRLAPARLPRKTPSAWDSARHRA